MFDSNDDTYEVLTFEDPPEGMRIDVFLAEKSGLSRSRIAALMDAGLVYAFDTPLKKSAKASGSEVITVLVPPPETLSAEPENIPLSIVYEDDCLLVVDKPQGMVVHPAAGAPNHTLVNALLYHCASGLSGINGVLRPGIVHRIDKDTSGLLVVAKTDQAHRSLAEQIKEHTVDRNYLAILWGAPKQEQGTIHTAIGRAKIDRKKMAVYPLGAPDAKEAKTSFTVLERFERFSYVQFTLFTGRTHQIRAHASHMGHPVVGDPVYAPGRDSMGQSGQLLHAATLGFAHPETGQRLLFESAPPPNFQKFLNTLRKQTQTS